MYKVSKSTDPNDFRGKAGSLLQLFVELPIPGSFVESADLDGVRIRILSNNTKERDNTWIQYNILNVLL